MPTMDKVARSGGNSLLVRFVLSALVAGILVGVGAMLIPRKLASPRMPTPGHLSPLVRRMLTERMENHQVDMADLEQAILLLDFKTAADLATLIAERPTLARPTAQDATQLNSWLPPRFFRLSDELQERAGALAAAARSQDLDKVAEAYGRVMQTCVTCHGVYLHEKPAQVPNAP